MLGVGPLVAHHRVDLPGAGGRLIHCLRVGEQGAGRLVAQHVLARLKGPDGHGGVLFVRRHNDHGVKTLRILIHLLFRAEYFD